jgi:AraC family transcriptional regulator
MAVSTFGGSVDFRGRVLRTRQAGVIRLTETVAPRNAVFASHVHQRPYISCLLAGTYREVVGVLEQECSVGTVIWHLAGEVHWNRFGEEGGHLLNVEVDPAAAHALQPEIDLEQPRHVFRSGQAFAAGLSLFRALNSVAEEIEERAFELLALVPRGSTRPLRPAWLCSALELVHQRFDVPLRLKDIAREFGVHPVHVARTFREGLGCTLSDLISRLRVCRACELLCQARWNVAQVAAQCGFADHAHLCRTFKRVTGLTPSAYRAHVGSTPARVNPVQARRPALW